MHVLCLELLQYWPSKDTDYEAFKVVLTSSDSSNGYDHYKFVMSNQVTIQICSFYL